MSRERESFLDEIQPFIDHEMSVGDNVERLIALKVIKERDEVSEDEVVCMIQANKDAKWEDDNYDVYEHGMRG